VPERVASSGRAPPDFRAVYETWFEPVSRWIRALGGREADREDIVQEVFVVVRRRLPSFEGDNLAPWLYRITYRLVRDFARRAWVTRFFTKEGRGAGADSLADVRSPEASALDALERKEGVRILDAVLAKMPAERRATFVLFEIEGLTGEEIAQLQGVPANTVWTRLHRARKEFFELAARMQRVQEVEEARRRRRFERDQRDKTRSGETK